MPKQVAVSTERADFIRGLRRDMEAAFDARDSFKEIIDGLCDQASEVAPFDTVDTVREFMPQILGARTFTRVVGRDITVIKEAARLRIRYVELHLSDRFVVVMVIGERGFHRNKLWSWDQSIEPREPRQTNQTMRTKRRRRS